MMSSALALAVASASLALPCAGQPTIPPGTRVRVSVGDTVDAARPSAPTRYVGTVKSTDPYALAIDVGLAEPVSVPLSSVRQIDVSRGRPSHRVIGGVIGGVITGGLFVAAACAFSNGSCDIGDHVSGFVAYYAVGAIPGVFIGRSIAARHPGVERWEPVWPPGRVGLGLPVRP